MIAFKMARKRKDGSYAPLYINASMTFPVGETIYAELHPKSGFEVRKGFHCLQNPSTPHLKLSEGRVWLLVDVGNYEVMPRPDSQGGDWILAQNMTVIREIEV